MNICFIVNKNLDQNSYSFIFPVLLNQKFFPYNVEIKNSIPSKNYDIIIIDSKFFIDWFNKNNAQGVIDCLFKLKKISKKLVYADNEASIYINYKIINNCHIHTYTQIHLTHYLENELTHRYSLSSRTTSASRGSGPFLWRNILYCICISYI